MKIVYDIDEKDLDKKCYLVRDDGSTEPILFWDIKFETDVEAPEFKRWPAYRLREAHREKLKKDGHELKRVLVINDVEFKAKVTEIINNTKDTPPEFVDIVNKHFWDLF